jgi:phosphopantothenoylcysteine decarboxylase/phosphopantothenate--cysteine ligase
MNTRMWQSTAVRENVAELVRRGWNVVGPGSGVLADGDVGPGRLAEPEEIAIAAAQLLRPRDLVGRRLVVTAGPTREPIDPVRFVSNPSTGKMGFAVARAAARRGADVVLVTGPVDLADVPGARMIRVVTAEEMARAVDAEASQGFDAFIGAAAVSDFRPAAPAASKKKKAAADEQLVLTRTRDILAGLGEKLGGAKDAPVLVGFAAETDAVVEHARQKLAAKRCDLIVANDVRRPGAGFAGDTNHVTFVSAAGQVEVAGTKDAVAEAILDQVAPVLARRRPRA